MRPTVAVFAYLFFATAIVTVYFVVPAFLMYWGLKFAGFESAE